MTSSQRPEPGRDAGSSAAANLTRESPPLPDRSTCSVVHPKRHDGHTHVCYLRGGHAETYHVCVCYHRWPAQ